MKDGTPVHTVFEAAEMNLKLHSLQTVYIYRSVPQIRPPFCNFSFSTKRRGGLYAGCDNFSRDYALPSDEHKASHSAMPCARWGAGQAQGVAEREAERCSRR